MSEIDDDEDGPQLSAETFLALQEFYNERQLKENQHIVTSEGAALDEDWQLSQFWYDERTTEILSKIALNQTGPHGKIALISCPTLYKKIKESLDDQGEVHLYEYDKRFSSYGEDFIHYDYKSPLDIPRDRASYYDIVIADPPFLSEECLTKTAVTIKFLTKSEILLCTGAVMADLANQLLQLKKTSVKPQHKNNLGNEFCCYTNFEVKEVDG